MAGPESRGFIFDLMDQLENNANIHRRLIHNIEAKIGRSVIVYQANLGHPASLMMDQDAEVLENMLSTIERAVYENKLDLFLHSPGGLPEAAAKIVRVCRAYAVDFRVVIPSTAMSAATLVSMGADAIVMGDTSKLGPIDPQMPNVDRSGRQFLRPAKSYIDAFTALVNEAHAAIAAKRPAQAFLHLLNAQDPSWIIECSRARKATEELAKAFLAAHMLKGKSPEQIQHVVNNFIAAGDEGTHGSPIFWDKAKAFGLNIVHEDKDGEVWRLIRELFVRVEHYAGAKGLAKYVVCRTGGIDMNVQVRQLGGG
jgi:hypothetical protein